MKSQFLFLSFFFLNAHEATGQCMQSWREQAGTVSVCTWDRSIPLADYLRNDVGVDANLVMIGYSAKSVFTFEAFRADNIVCEKWGKIFETDTNGVRTEWSSIDIFGYDIVNDHRPDSVLKNLHPKTDLHFDDLSPLSAWPGAECQRWVAKANIIALKKCFTWYEEGTNICSGYKVKITPYAHSREIEIYGSLLTVPLNYQSDSLMHNKTKLILGKDTILFTHMDLWSDEDDTMGNPPLHYNYNGEVFHGQSLSSRSFDFNYDSLGPVPIQWIGSQENELWCDHCLAQSKYQMAHPTPAMKKKYPLLKTHSAYYIKNYFRWPDSGDLDYELMIVLAPLNGQPGKIYLIENYSCYKSIDYLIAETPVINTAAQARYMKIFRTMTSCW